jgi:CBS domain containing-hemolysin-like protein
MVVALLAANAFLVAAEYALISVRRSRIEQQIRQGDARAARVLPALEHLAELTFAGQVARSAASVLLGWHALDLGRIYLLPLLGPGRRVPVLNSTTEAAAGALAIAAVAFLHATLGQQVPKLVALHRAESVAAGLGLPVLQLLSWVFKPVLWPLNQLVRLLLRPFGLNDAALLPTAQPDEELRALVAAGGDPSEIEDAEREMIRGVFEISETVAREVMTPRTAMVAVPVDVTLAGLLDVFAEEAHSRLPVYDGTIDTIVGVVLQKDVFPLLRHVDVADGFDIRTIARPPYFVPESKPVSDVLREFRQQRVHLAIVLDEFGGTYGLVTMEDLLEEIVGEINDEYDVVEPEFETTPEGDVLIDGGASVSEVNTRFDLTLPEADFDTVGGFVFGTLGRVPRVGDVVAVPGDDSRELRVEELDERRITCVRLARVAPVSDGGGS